MAGPPLTVPPPLDDDHEDVAWALRAASAQWRRAARDDAVHWVVRAAETAAEVGAPARAQELRSLAGRLGIPQDAVAPPPPVSAEAVPASARTSAPASVEFDEVEVEFDDDEVEMLDDDVEFVEDVEEVEDVNEVTDLGEVGAPSSALAAAEPAQVTPRQDSELPPPRRSTTAPKIDMLPPSMRPEPSGLDLDDEVETGDEEEDEDEVDYGELEFEDEVPTARVSVSSAPPVPEMSQFSMGASSDVPMDAETAAEYAQSGVQAPPPRHSDEDLEEEFGVDLNVRPGPVSQEASRQQWEAQAEARGAFDEAMSEPELEGDSELPPPSPSSLPPGALDGAPSRPEHSPVPGRASVHPSQVPEAAPRVTSGEREPYGMAPSAAMPPEESVPAPPIEPPSRPITAPPPERMSEPEDRPSAAPGLDSSVIPPSSAAPDPDEFEEMFAKLSQPPPPVDLHPAGEVPDTAAPEAPPPPDVASAEAAPEEPGTLVDGVDLLEVDGFQDLPQEAAADMAQQAQLRSLAVGEELSGFGVALVTRGAVQMMPTVSDAPCRIARKGEVLFTHGTIAESAQVRIVGSEPDSRVATFSKEQLEKATSACPWVADELAEVADKYLAFAGAVLGSLGDSLDDMFRFMVLEKCSVKSKGEGGLVAEGGKPMDGMYIVGAGSLELLDGEGKVTAELAMGDFVFPETVLSAGPASQSVRVGMGGALLLYADRMAAHELLATCPPFIELLAG